LGQKHTPWHNFSALPQRHVNFTWLLLWNENNEKWNIFCAFTHGWLDTSGESTNPTFPKQQYIGCEVLFL